MRKRFLHFTVAAALFTAAVTLWPAAAVAQPFGGARLQVKPHTAEVFVDGFYVGSVDQFDGFLQRLDVPAGEHELTLYDDGYRTMTQRVLFRPGVALNIKYDMQPLAPGEAPEPRPQSRDAARPASGAPPSPRIEGPSSSSAFGTLAIRVQPAGATVLIDGEEWAAPEGSGPMRIELGAGDHTIEVRKEGYSTFQRTVRTQAGGTVSLNVSLSR